MSMFLKNVKLWLRLWCDCWHGEKNVLAAAQWQMRWWRCLHICHRHMLLFLENRCWLWMIWSTDVLLCSQYRTDCVWYLTCKNGKNYYWNKCLVVVILQSEAENLGYLVFSQKLCCSHVGQADWNSSTSTGWIAFPTDANVLKQQSLMALINLLIFWGWHTHVLVLIAVKIDADVPVPLKIVQFWFGNKSNFFFFVL